MATKNETPPPAPIEAPAAPKKKLGKILIIAGVVLVLLIGGGTAAFLALTKHQAVDDPELAAADDEKPKKKKKDEKDDRRPSYMTLEPFTVNLVSETGDQFLQVALTLDMLDLPAVEKAKIYTAKIRNDIMLHLSGKKPAELATKEGKQILAVELRNQINLIIDPDAAKRSDKVASAPVKEVLFTSFIIQ